MRKLVSFSVFAMIVILSLIAKNTVEAQVVVRPTVVVTPVAVRPLCPGPGYVWRRGIWVMRPHYRYRMGYGVRWHVRPIRNTRYGW